MAHALTIAAFNSHSTHSNLFNSQEPRMSPIPSIFLKHLDKLEPNAQFTFSSPRLKSSSGITYYAKIGTASEHAQYTAEVESLKALGTAAPGLVPKVIASGFFTQGDEESKPGTGRPYFLSEYKELGSLSSEAATILGRRLAEEVHSYKGTNGFGFHVPTYCGPTRMENGWYSSWDKCFDALIAGLLFHLKSSRYSALRAKGEQVRQRYVFGTQHSEIVYNRLYFFRVIPTLLDPDKLVIQPVIIHGDLWVRDERRVYTTIRTHSHACQSGNMGEDNNGQPIIYDPSSMFAHNEFE